MNTDAIVQKEHFHGSDIEKIEQKYAVRKEELRNFSANVNPFGLSKRLKEHLAANLDVLSAYPDREYTRLRQSIAKYCGANWQHVIVGNGTSELISLAIQLCAPKYTLIIAPTYSEYEREATLFGSACAYITLSEENDFRPDMESLLAQILPQADLLILCNPNNPTGGSLPTADIERILIHCQQTGTLVMADETYIEFSGQYAQIASIPLTARYDNLIVLRGVSKFFAAPGLRLGYAVTSNETLAAGMRQKQDPWTVNSLAEEAGILMFHDTDYIQCTRQLIETERARMCAALAAMQGLKPYPCDANFMLVKIEKDGINANMLFEAAIKNHMVIRDCSSFVSLDQRYFRFCFLFPKDNDRLLSCIQNLI